MRPDEQAVHDAALTRLQRALQPLPDKPDETATTTLRALWHLAAGDRLSVQAAAETALPALDGEAMRRLHDLLDQRLQGTPLAHITGRERFMGLDMLAGAQALIPRRETELLARTAIALVDAASAALVLDACTGSANVAASIAAARPLAQVHASDLSTDALELAQRNIEHLGLTSRVSLHHGDLLGAFDATVFAGHVDLIACNPPYISTARRAALASEIASHEPSLAFDGGALGVRILQRLVRDAPAFLRDGGWLVFEIGAGQGRAVADRLRADGRYDEITPVNDATGEVRVLRARHRGSA
jgi:release factor glutamine methyltransferase